MKAIHRWLRGSGIGDVRRTARGDARPPDVGCADGALLRQIGPRSGQSVVVDTHLDAPVEEPGFRLVPGRVPDCLPDHRLVDVVAMLAVLEHIPPEGQGVLERHCFELVAARRFQLGLNNLFVFRKPD